MTIWVHLLLIGGVAATIGIADMDKHASIDSCWLMINGGVYDVTWWLPKHPGGNQVLLRHCGKDASKSFGMAHQQELAVLCKVAGGLVKNMGNLNLEASLARPSTRNRDFVTDETNLTPFAKVALHRVHNHAIVQKNAYTEWFARGSASISQIKQFIVQFSVFSNLFLEAQLRKVLNAPSLHEMREGKEILANELGVVFNSEGGKRRRDEQSGVGFGMVVDPTIVSTEGTVEGGYYSHKAAHFEWLLDVGKSMGLEFEHLGKRKHGTNSTLFFCDQLYNLYGSDDLSISLGASFAIEHWANAGFWDDIVDGFQAINDRNVLETKVPLGFWLFHQALEGQHAAHTMDELEEAIERKRIPDYEKFLKAADEILDAVEIFWNDMPGMWNAGKDEL